jgi:uncharacterized SAM-binding protein YcdF (DUF218 family)
MFKCIKLLVALIVLSLLVFAGHSLLLDKAGRYLFKKDELKPADVIVVLAGEEKERIQYGVRLFKEGWSRKDRIVMSGGPAVGDRSSAALMKEYAAHLGVPAGDILTEERSRSTEENALYTKTLLDRKGYTSIILVTSPYHSKRASVIFRAILGRRWKIIDAPCEPSWFSFDGWWRKPRDRDTVLSEFSKFLRIWIFGVGTEAPGRNQDAT